MRIRFYRIILTSLFILLSLGLFFVQLLKGGNYYKLSLRNSIRLISEEPYRGRILDRNGIAIADNVLSFDACIIPQELKTTEAVFKRLSGMLSLDEDEVYRRYDRGYLNPFTPVPMAVGISKTTAIMIEDQNFDLEGVTVQLNARRFYPHGTTASHVLGYMGEIDKSSITRLKGYGYDIKDRIGYSGLEEKLDIFLRGEKGGQQIEVDNRGRQVRVLGYRPPVSGQDIQTTLDLELQQIADGLLEGRKGALVIMDVDTGDILVMSSAPVFDPNVFIDRKDKKSLNYFLTSEDAPLFNRATRGQFPPGSVFKVVTAAAALKTKKVSTSRTFVCTGKLRVGNREFKCWSVHGSQDFYQAMAHSCDVYFYQLGLVSGPDALTNLSREFGLSSPTGIDLSHEAGGFVPSRLWKRLSRFENWYDGDTANFAIGQGFVLTTPLQLARMMAAVANGGYLVTPRVTKKIGDLSLEPKEPKKINISKEDLDVIRNSLRLPVLLETGTAHILNIKGLEVCAKTGTAQVSSGESHGWVAGFFPLAHPRYAYCVILENVGSSAYACQLGKALFEEAVKRDKFR